MGNKFLDFLVGFLLGFIITAFVMITFITIKSSAHTVNAVNTVCIVGDSLSSTLWSFGPKLGRLYAHDNGGIPGVVTAEWKPNGRFKDHIDDCNGFEVVSITLGTNDHFFKIPSLTQAFDYYSVAEAFLSLPSNPIVVLWISPGNEINEDVACALLPVICLFQSEILLPSHYVDGAHPNELGKQIMADVFKEALYNEARNRNNSLQ